MSMMQWFKVIVLHCPHFHVEMGRRVKVALRHKFKVALLHCPDFQG